MHDDLSPLRFSLAASQAVSTVESELHVMLTLRNGSATRLVVNRRLLVNHDTAPADAGEVSLHVTGPPGYFSLQRYHVSARAASREFFVALAPGESVKKEIRLTDYESLHDPGEYVLRATYRCLWSPPDLSPAAWTGTVESDALRIIRSE